MDALQIEPHSAVSKALQRNAELTTYTYNVLLRGTLHEG